MEALLAPGIDGSVCEGGRLNESFLAGVDFLFWEAVPGESTDKAAGDFAEIEPVLSGLEGGPIDPLEEGVVELWAFFRDPDDWVEPELCDSWARCALCMPFEPSPVVEKARDRE